MTLTKRSLKKLCESWRIVITGEQERLILERFSEEPYPYEWGEQDITEQIRQIIHDDPGRKGEQQTRPLTFAASSDPNKQVKVSVPPNVAAAFKKMCADNDVSMAGELTQYMADYASVEKGKKDATLDFSTKRKRRKAIKSIIKQLEQIKGFEEQYRDNIPENLQGSTVYDNAEECVAWLEEAIELLDSF